MNTTAEFMIGRSADDAAERRQELRKIAWAVLAALLLHVVVGSFMAAFSGFFSRDLPVDDKPVELTIVDMPVPEAEAKKPANAMFRMTDPARASAEKPKDAVEQSNENSIGASEQPATSTEPVPSQNGGSRPNDDLTTQDATLAQEGAQPQPTRAPQDEASPSPSAAPTATPMPDALAMLRATPTPAAKPSATPQQIRSTYHPMMQQKRMTGAISNRGPSSFNTVGTPLGKYQKMLYDAVGSRWYSYVQQQADLVTIGTAHLVFSVDRTGRVRNLKIVQNTSNESFANVCLRSILEVQLPPIPEDVAGTLPSEGLEEEMSFTMYAN